MTYCLSVPSDLLNELCTQWIIEQTQVDENEPLSTYIVNLLDYEPSKQVRCTIALLMSHLSEKKEKEKTIQMVYEQNTTKNESQQQEVVEEEEEQVPFSLKNHISTLFVKYKYQ